MKCQQDTVALSWFEAALTFMSANIGTSQYTLEMHCDGHRHSHFRMESVVEHVGFQLPNQSTMVRYLLDTIECKDALLMTGVANIQCDLDLNRKLHNYKLAMVFLLPACPVALCLARGEPIAEIKLLESAP